MNYSPTITEQQKYWDTRWGKHGAPNDWQIRRGEKVLEMLESVHVSHPKILDLGCATGWFTQALSQKGEVLGVDLSETAIATAKDRYPNLNFIAGNLFDIPFEKGIFDVVVTQEVIAHVEDQSRFLERIVYVLKPGGHMVITSANKLVMDRVDSRDDPREHIKKWLSIRDLKSIIKPFFNILHLTTIIPMGDHGYLRLINSHKLNTVVGYIIPMKYLEYLKEKTGIGYSIIILAQKK